MKEKPQALHLILETKVSNLLEALKAKEAETMAPPPTQVREMTCL